MSGPARAGVFLYAKQLDSMATFYEAVLGMTTIHASPELLVLQSRDLQLVLHAIPNAIADGIRIERPPVRRENRAMKFCHVVPSLGEAGRHAAALGGEVFAERWEGAGFTMANAMDPEGNVFQVRESLAT
jgi:predicted enzyme related to lactoylglutathione lyase